MHLPILSKPYNAYIPTNTNISTYFNKILYQNKTHTCYNVFFLQYNLLLLTENELLGSFLTHLSNYSFLQPLLISINQTLTETYIYFNLNKSIFKNYQILKLN